MGSWKLEKRLTAGALPELLRELAAALESGRAEGVLAGLPGDEFAGLPANARKLVLVAKAAADLGGGFDVTLKVKREGEVRVPTKSKARKDADAVPQGKDPNGVPAPATGQASGHAGGQAGSQGAAARAREKYRQLKKAMQADYKALRKAAEAGVAPPQDLLESFLALAESMTEAEQPLKDPRGPEASELAKANAAFFEDARALRRAVSARDAAALTEVLGRLERRKAACHAQFRSLRGG